LYTIIQPQYKDESQRNSSTKSGDNAVQKNHISVESKPRSNKNQNTQAFPYYLGMSRIKIWIQNYESQQNSSTE